MSHMARRLVVPDDLIPVIVALNKTRYEMLKTLYYKNQSKYSDMITAHGLGLGQFYMHVHTLTKHGLIRKKNRGVYEITDLGRRIVEAVETGTLWNKIKEAIQG